MKKVVMFLACLMFICANRVSKATKIKAWNQKGIVKMTFMCKFSMTDMKNVTWLMNGKNIEGYPHFKVTNKYKKKHNKNILVSTLKVIRPEIAVRDSELTCESDDESHTFQDVGGIDYTHIEEGTAEFSFGRNYYKYNLPIENVKRTCRNWKTIFAHFPRKNRRARKHQNCYTTTCSCESIKVFQFESTVTEETKIKPDPFISLQLHDYINLPENYNVTITFREWNETEYWRYGRRFVEDDHKNNIYVRNITTPNVTVSRKEFKPDTEYIAYVFWSHPFDHAFKRRNGEVYRHLRFNAIFANSSSLEPGTPTVSSASLKENKCRIKLKFPVNVDVKDTYDHFKPQILVNGEIANNFSRINDYDFEFDVDENIENSISVRILSTVEKYNSELSDPIKCQ